MTDIKETVKALADNVCFRDATNDREQLKPINEKITELIQNLTLVHGMMPQAMADFVEEYGAELPAREIMMYLSPKKGQNILAYTRMPVVYSERNKHRDPEKRRKSRKAYSEKYDVNRTIKFNRRTDDDILTYLETVDNFNGFAKKAIRYYIRHRYDGLDTE